MVISLFVIAYGGAVFLVLKSDAYRMAVMHLKHDGEILQSFGEIQSIRISLGRLDARFSRSYSELRFSVCVRGTRRVGSVAVLACKSATTEWRVCKLEHQK